jgi:hypothetical protein
VAEFYRSLNIQANTNVCDSARSFNYICGCSDTLGYAGANSDTKMIALAWCPRVGALLSLLVSDLYLTTVHSAYLAEWHPAISVVEFIL